MWGIQQVFFSASAIYLNLNVWSEITEVLQKQSPAELKSWKTEILKIRSWRTKEVKSYTREVLLSDV